MTIKEMRVMKRKLIETFVVKAVLAIGLFVAVSASVSGMSGKDPRPGPLEPKNALHEELSKMPEMRYMLRLGDNEDPVMGLAAAIAAGVAGTGDDSIGTDADTTEAAELTQSPQQDADTENNPASGGHAVDFTHGPDCLQPGNILISGGINVGNASASYSAWKASASVSASTFGFTLAVDYALAKYGLTVGAETGYSGGSFIISFGAIPFMGRFGYHPDFGVPNLDAYALVKIGFAIGFAGGESSGGFGIGFGIGGRYYFTDNFGAFAELGLDSYFFSVYGSGSITGRKIFTIGATYKL